MMKQDQQNKIITIPNLLSLFRLCLIPVFVWLYCEKEDYMWAGGILILSGLTDVVDGFVARQFHMISDVGKVLDPVADKLTQGAVLVCLLTRFPFIWAPLILLVVKELFAAVTGFLVIRKTGEVYGAKWHGKAATCLLYAMMIVHVFWYDITPACSNTLITASIGIMLLSLVLYGIRNINALKTKGGPG